MVSKQTGRIWKSSWTLCLAVAVFILCLFPYRALMNFHEQTHLFRWNGYYLTEQSGSFGGIREYIVSFVTQFFYIGWLGALVMAVIAIGIQLLTWQILKLCRVRWIWCYPVSLIPSLLMFYFVFIPSAYKTDEQFREVVTYDYLVRAQKWKSILARSYNHEPQTMCGIWCTNYALAKRGSLLNDMFLFKQDSPDGLLMDAVRMDPMTLYSLSDISLDLGMINSAERFAFDVKQRLPHGNKSGRIYKRLAETNLINGNYKVAKKYMQILQSTLFYNNIAEGDYERYRAIRQKSNDELAQAKNQILSQLTTENPQNKLAADYLLAYEMLRLDVEHVSEYTLMLRKRDNWDYTPKAVQEAVIGYWIMKHPNDSLPFSVNKDLFENTTYILKTVQSTGNMTPAELEVPPYNQSYWHYHTQSILKLKQLRK
ncbi:MAG: hypothetical protein IJ580_07540 [Prevotella sp.]|nr:hypothetical protein [Prevotella sp.]MBR1556780.1 hypothetical protein [Prevotella sp.]